MPGFQAGVRIGHKKDESTEAAKILSESWLQRHLRHPFNSAARDRCGRLYEYAVTHLTESRRLDIESATKVKSLMKARHILGQAGTSMATYNAALISLSQLIETNLGCRFDTRDYRERPNTANTLGEISRFKGPR